MYYISYNMGTRDLPDMYALGFWAYISGKFLVPMLLLYNITVHTCIAMNCNYVYTFTDCSFLQVGISTFYGRSLVTLSVCSKSTGQCSYHNSNNHAADSLVMFWIWSYENIKI